MLRKTRMVLAAASLLAASSAAQAGDKYDGDSPHLVGAGYRIGPLGQRLGGLRAWRGRPRSIYAYVPRARLDRRRYYVR
jgi:hypothetical protein